MQATSGKQTTLDFVSLCEFVAFGFESMGNHMLFHLHLAFNKGPVPASRSIPEIAKAKVTITKKTTPKHKRIWWDPWIL